MEIYKHPGMPHVFLPVCTPESISNLRSMPINSVAEFLAAGLPIEVLIGSSILLLSPLGELIEHGAMEPRPAQLTHLNLVDTFEFLAPHSPTEIVAMAFSQCNDEKEYRKAIRSAASAPTLDMTAWLQEEEIEGGSDTDSVSYWEFRHLNDPAKTIRVRYSENYDLFKVTLASLESSSQSPSHVDNVADALHMVSDRILFEKYADDREQYKIVEVLPSLDAVEHAIPVHLLLSPDELRQLADHMERVDETISIKLPAELDDTEEVSGSTFSFVGCDIIFEDYRGFLNAPEKGIIIRANHKHYLVPKQMLSVTNHLELTKLLSAIKHYA